MIRFPYFVITSLICTSILEAQYVPSQHSNIANELEDSNAILAATRSATDQSIEKKLNVFKSTDTTKYSYYVALVDKYSGDKICGGSLISSRYAISAAHCNCTTNNTVVHIGRHNFSDEDESSFEEIGIEAEILHPEYDPDTMVNDIMIMKLEVESSYEQETNFTYYAAGNHNWLPEDQELATALGWNLTDNDEGTNSSDVLMEKEVYIMSNEECNDIYANYSNTTGSNVSITSNMMCASSTPGEDGGRGWCDEDSGGPLVVVEDSGDVQIGIMSFGGGGCDNGDYPGVYTRVDKYTNFIECVISSEGMSSECNEGGDYDDDGDDYDYDYDYYCGHCYCPFDPISGEELRMLLLMLLLLLLLCFICLPFIPFFHLPCCWPCLGVIYLVLVVFSIIIENEGYFSNRMSMCMADIGMKFKEFNGV